MQESKNQINDESSRKNPYIGSHSGEQVIRRQDTPVEGEARHPGV